VHSLCAWPPLVEVEVAAVAVHRLIGGAQVVGVGDSMLRLAREAVRFGHRCSRVQKSVVLPPGPRLALGIERPVRIRNHVAQHQPDDNRIMVE
jgi:hypothetical protein